MNPDQGASSLIWVHIDCNITDEKADDKSRDWPAKG